MTIVGYRGPSVFNGAPVVLVGSCVDAPSQNRKTGPMVQVSVAPVGRAPRLQTSICPAACPYRDPAPGATACYVNWGQSPRNAELSARTVPALPVGFAMALRRSGRPVRFGSSGDVAAVPRYALEPALNAAVGHTMYTADWNSGGRSDWLAPWSMASATVAQLGLAEQAGWRCFVVHRGAIPLALSKRIVECPSSKGVTCEKCLLCNGNPDPTDGRPHIAILDHGPTARRLKVLS